MIETKQNAERIAEKLDELISAPMPRQPEPEP